MSSLTCFNLSVCCNVFARRSAMPESWCRRKTRQRLWLRLATRMMAAATQQPPARRRCQSQRRQCLWLCRQPQQRRLRWKHNGSSLPQRHLRVSRQATHQQPPPPPRLASPGSRQLPLHRRRRRQKQQRQHQHQRHLSLSHVTAQRRRLRQRQLLLRRQRAFRQQVASLQWLRRRAAVRPAWQRRLQPVSAAPASRYTPLRE